VDIGDAVLNIGVTPQHVDQWRSRVDAIDDEEAKARIAKRGAHPPARMLDGLGVLTREAKNNPKKAPPKKKALKRAAAIEKAKAATAEKASAAAEALSQDAVARDIRSSWRLAP
jgi:hypothetical protein